MPRKVAATCPCCGYVVFEEPPGSYAICPICFWEDDEVQLRFPTLRGGANGPSLIEAQQNFSQLGACEQRFTGNVRMPDVDENRDPDWRLIDLSMDEFEKPFAPGEEFTAYPEDFTTLYYWRRRKQE
jgi:hypothetical protein